jgi:tetratricopeptide (TPR) repeat protein
MGSRELEADTQRLLGEAYLGEKQMDRASHATLQALTITTEIGNRLIEGQVLRTLGRISFAKADLEGAGRHFQASLSIFTNLRNPFELAETQFELALLERMLGHSSQARQLLETACATFERLGAESETQRARNEVGALTSPAADSVSPAE